MGVRHPWILRRMAAVLKVIVPVLTTLLGSIIGFYYGSNRGGG